MGNITFIEHDGAEHQVELEAGKSLMQIAMDNGVPGIDADCGGECACGTCHVIVDSAWLDVAGKAGCRGIADAGDDPERKPASRLSCQIKATDAMDGMVVHLPEFQM
jgi:2Fe-2S ferredoxin